MYFAMKTLAVFCLLFVLCHAVDPWDVKVKAGGIIERIECKCEDNIQVKKDQESDLVGEVLYKKLVLLILSKSKFKEKNGIYDGSTCFHIPEDVYHMLQKYVNSQNRLTASEIRKIDGILSEYICKSSFVTELFESVSDYVHYVLKHYWVHLLIGITAISCCLVIYMSDWSNVSVKSIVLWVVLVFVYLWEVNRLIEEAEHNEMMHSLRKCTYDFIFYRYVTEGCFTVSGISKVLQYGNPIYVIPNIFTKLILGNITLFMETINKFIVKICENVNAFYYTPVYVALNILFFGIIIFLTFALIANYVFNQSFSMNFLFFNFNIRERLNHVGNGGSHLTQAQQQLQVQSQPQQQLENKSLDSENISALIGIVKDLVQTKTNPSTAPANGSGDTPATTNQTTSISRQESKAQSEEYKHDNLLCKPMFKQKRKRVSSVPDNLSRLGGGDYLS